MVDMRVGGRTCLIYFQGLLGIFLLIASLNANVYIFLVLFSYLGLA